MSVKNNKAINKSREDLVLEPIQSSPLFTEPPTSIPPIQSTPYIEAEAEGATEDFDLQADEAELAAEEGEEVAPEPVAQEPKKSYFYWTSQNPSRKSSGTR